MCNMSSRWAHNAVSDLVWPLHKLGVPISHYSLIFWDSTPCCCPALPSVLLSDDPISSDISVPRYSSLLASPHLYPMMPIHIPQVGDFTRQSWKRPYGYRWWARLWWPSCHHDGWVPSQNRHWRQWGCRCHSGYLGHQNNKWPIKVPESMISPYSCQQLNLYQDKPIFHTRRSMPLLATILLSFQSSSQPL